MNTLHEIPSFHFPACDTLPRLSVGFVAAAVSMSMGGCRAVGLVGVSLVAAVIVDVAIAVEPAVL